MKLIEIEGISVNKKFYNKFMKALKGFEVSQTVKNNHLIISYGDGLNNGILSLRNQRG